MSKPMLCTTCAKISCAKQVIKERSIVLSCTAYKKQEKQK
jgi:hypothetical protein